MESTTKDQITDAEWQAAQAAGLLTAAPGTNAQDAAIHRFAEAIRAEATQADEPSEIPCCWCAGTGIDGIDRGEGRMPRCGPCKGRGSISVNTA